MSCSSWQPLRRAKASGRMTEPQHSDETDGTPPHGDPLLAASQGHPQGDGSRHGWGAHLPEPAEPAGDADTAEP